MPGGKQSSKDNASEHMPLQSLPTLSLNAPVSLRGLNADVPVAVGVSLIFAPGAGPLRAFAVTRLDAFAVGFPVLRAFPERGARRLDAFAERGVWLDAFAERGVRLDAFAERGVRLDALVFARTSLAQRIEVATETL